MELRKDFLPSSFSKCIDFLPLFLTDFEDDKYRIYILLTRPDVFDEVFCCRHFVTSKLVK